LTTKVENDNYVELTIDLVEQAVYYETVNLAVWTTKGKTIALRDSGVRCI